MNEIKPGPELNTLIAEKVMGWTLTEEKGPNSYDYFCWKSADGKVGHSNNMFMPSTNIADAWKVVEKLRDKSLQFELRVSPGTLWIVWVARLSMIPFQEDELLAEAKGDTAPYAICLAALKAIEGVKLDHLNDSK